MVQHFWHLLGDLGIAKRPNGTKLKSANTIFVLCGLVGVRARLNSTIAVHSIRANNSYLMVRYGTSE